MFLPIIWGEKLYGHVDRVPGLFYVATMFFYFYWFPLFPIRTYLVLENTAGHSRRDGIPFLYSSSETTFAGVPMPWSHRSMWLAWGQVFLLLIWALGGTITLVSFVDPYDSTLDNLMRMAIPAIALVLWLYLVIVPGRRMPSYERACELARLANYTPMGFQRLNKIYGRSVMPALSVVVDPHAGWGTPAAKPPAYETSSVPEPVVEAVIEADDDPIVEAVVVDDDDPLAELAQLTRPRPPAPHPVPPFRRARGR